MRFLPLLCSFAAAFAFLPLHAATVEKLKIADYAVTVKVPDAPAAGKPWLWVGEFGGHLKSLEDGLVEQGWHVVYVSASNLFGSTRAMEVWDKVYEQLRSERALAPRPAFLGISRGGLYVNAWTRRHPDRVSVLCLDKAVCDIRSWPAGFQLSAKGKGSPKDWDLYKTEFQFGSDEDALKRSTRPTDGMEPALKANVLLISVHGTADTVVPYVDNAQKLVEFWEKNGGRSRTFSKEGGDHHPHGLPDPKPVLDLFRAESQQPR
jgi:pimeloyl-ACP methyl ester carboxylesterase